MVDTWYLNKGEGVCVPCFHQYWLSVTPAKASEEVGANEFWKQGSLFYPYTIKPQVQKNSLTLSIF